MELEEDAYGQEVWAHYNGKRSYEIVERDDGYFDVSSGVETYFSRYDDWPIYEKKSVECVEGRVLDIGCGAGRHSLYLQEKGFDVLGIDISPLAIQVCKLRGLKNGRVMSIYDVEFPPNSFDTILMMGNNFGLLGNYIQAKELLNRFYQFTTNNEVIIANSNDPYKTDNPIHLDYHKLNRKRGRLSGQLRLRIRFGKFVTPWFEYLLVSKDEMKDILHGTGWEIKEVIDSDTSSYIAIIRKLT